MRIAMNRAFQAFIDELAVNPDSVGLFGAMRNIAHAFELPSFAYILAPSDKSLEVKLISNYPVEWTSHYLDNHYEGRDPVIQMAKAMADPFDWGLDVTPAYGHRKSEAFMQEAASFGIRCGFTFPIHDERSHFAALSFASDRWSSGFRAHFERQRQVLHLLAILFHARARIALLPSFSIAGIRLTLREAECLSWAARGKSAWEIGKILNISRRTAAFHLDNAKMRLGVRTIQQAVALYVAAQRQ